MIHYRSRVDGNQKEIAEFLRKAGFSVFHAHAVGHGFPDLVIGRNGVTWLAECKVSKGKFTDSQKRFYAQWRGAPVLVFRSLGDAQLFVASNDNLESARQRADQIKQSEPLGPIELLLL